MEVSLEEGCSLIKRESENQDLFEDILHLAETDVWPIFPFDENGVEKFTFCGEHSQPDENDMHSVHHKPLSSEDIQRYIFLVRFFFLVFWF